LGNNASPDAYARFIRPALFRLDPERVHGLTLQALGLIGRFQPGRYALKKRYSLEDSLLKRRVFGLEFPNPVGLAAGYDKDGIGLWGLACLGVGHIEVGTVTPMPQPGNPRPRLFRLPDDQGLINRMGFPSQGVERLRSRLMHRPPGIVLGINLGKGADTPIERAEGDYLYLLERLYALGDYFVVNISSPNTPNLRRLQAREHLPRLLEALDRRRRDLEARHGMRKPVLVKLAPDLDPDEIEAIAQAVRRSDVDGVIATNTTTRRAGLRSRRREETGGLSGAPLRELSTALVAQLAGLLGGRAPIIASGGVMTPEDALEKLEVGASLVQIYTGLVYEGPGLVRRILQAILASTKSSASPA